MLEKKYYTISELAVMFGVTTSLIRYWEKKFKQLQPQKHQGIRKYTSADIEQFKKIFELVKEKGYTLRGAQGVLQPARVITSSKNEILKNLKEIRYFLETCCQQVDKEAARS